MPHDFIPYAYNLIAPLVQYPQACVITQSADEQGVLLTCRVHPDDMGRVIGRAGQTAKAIRTLLHVIGSSRHAMLSLKIEEPVGSTHSLAH